MTLLESRFDCKNAHSVQTGQSDSKEQSKILEQIQNMFQVY
jgi:hypothetical protein